MYGLVNSHLVTVAAVHCMSDTICKERKKPGKMMYVMYVPAQMYLMKTEIDFVTSIGGFCDWLQRQINTEQYNGFPQNRCNVK